MRTAPPTSREPGGIEPETLLAWQRVYGPSLRRFLSRRVPDAEAQDLVQEIFLAVHARRAEGRIENPQGYLFRIASHLLTRRRDLHAILAEDDPAAPPDLLSPERQLIAKEELERTLSAIRRLPPRAREAFILHRFEEMTYAAIARRMGVSLSAVRQLISRALAEVSQEVGRPR